MCTELKAIETLYKGQLYRSRLEARWAVAFDAMGIEFEYEPEGFETQDQDRYLPDFYFPEWDTYAEVKGNRPTAQTELSKVVPMIKWGGPIKRVLILGNIPGDYDGGMWHFPCLFYNGKSDGVDVGWWFFFDVTNNVVSGKISNANYRRPFYVRNEMLCKFGHGSEPFDFQAKSDRLLRKNEPEFWFDYTRIANETVFLAFDKARQTHFDKGAEVKA